MAHIVCKSKINLCIGTVNGAHRFYQLVTCTCTNTRQLNCVESGSPKQSKLPLKRDLIIVKNKLFQLQLKREFEFIVQHLSSLCSDDQMALYMNATKNGHLRNNSMRIHTYIRTVSLIRPILIVLYASRISPELPRIHLKLYTFLFMLNVKP